VFDKSWIRDLINIRENRTLKFREPVADRRGFCVSGPARMPFAPMHGLRSKAWLERFVAALSPPASGTQIQGRALRRSVAVVDLHA
jgi:hypothetical protein